MSGYSAALALATSPGVTAIFCSNDQMALGALRALQEAGRSVPHDVSVVGFDDVPESAYFLPPLTTVRQDFVELGRRGIDVLVDQIATGSRADQQIVLNPELVTRASTGYAPGCP